MDLIHKNIAFALTTGSLNIIESIILQIEELVKLEVNVFPIILDKKYNQYIEDKEFKNKIEKASRNNVIYTIKEAKLIEKEKNTELIIIAPCDSNTLAKLSNGILDTPVLISAKSHIINEKPVVIGISCSDGLSRKR